MNNKNNDRNKNSVFNDTYQQINEVNVFKHIEIGGEKGF